MTVAWRTEGGAGWVLDIADTNGVPSVMGIPLTTGTDLLAPYRHIGIPGGLWVRTDGDIAAVPTFANLGAASHLYWDDGVVAVVLKSDNLGSASSLYWGGGLGVVTKVPSKNLFVLDTSQLDGLDKLG